jgi:hypothetical protein
MTIRSVKASYSTYDQTTSRLFSFGLTSILTGTSDFIAQILRLIGLIT